MRDAIGGALTLPIIFFFLIVINAYLAFSVNYTKAFRVKNVVINAIEQYEGITGDFTDDYETKKNTKSYIMYYIKKVGYSGKNDNGQWKNGVKVEVKCVGPVGSSAGCPDNASSFVEGVKYKVYFSVTTAINFHVPIIEPIFERIDETDLGLLRVSGDTSMIYIDGKYIKDGRLEW